MPLTGIFLHLIQKVIIHFSDDLTCSKLLQYSVKFKLILMQTSKNEQVNNALKVLFPVQYEDNSVLRYRCLYMSSFYIYLASFSFL